MPCTLQGMDALISPQSADYSGSRTDTLANAVYLRLATPLGSYWQDPALGSRLHELQRLKDVARVAVLARQYAEQALVPLLDDGRAKRITVTTERQPARLALHIEVLDASGRTQTFLHAVKVA